MNYRFEKDHVVTIKDFTVDEMESIFELADEMIPIAEGEKKDDDLYGKLLTTLFYEPSTRTRLSFEGAMKRLGGRCIGFAKPGTSSAKKGETLADTIRVAAGYADVIVLRHHHEGAARLASKFSDVPVINAGDGANQHPTQTFLDLYTIQKTCGEIDNLKIGFIGDLRYSRTIHSLAEALSLFDLHKMYFISPEALKAPEYLLEELKEHEVQYHQFDKPDAILSELDVLYCTRIQEERFADRLEFEQVKSCYRIKKKLLEKCGAKESLKIMHPLPRVDELDTDIDSSQHAVYFQQAKNGVPVRQALLAMVLDKNFS